MKVERMLINICSEKLAASKDFYTKLFDFKVDYDSDWFIHLISESRQLELGIIKKSSEIVPEGMQGSPQGVYLTFVVPDVDEAFKIAKGQGIIILNEPADTFYGQRRLLLKDPNKTVVDISSPTSNQPA